MKLCALITSDILPKLMKLCALITSEMLPILMKLYDVMGVGTHGQGVLVRPLVPLAHVLVLVRGPHLDLNRAPMGCTVLDILA